MREEYIGELRSMVGLHLLYGEGVRARYPLQEQDTGLRGEFGGDPGHLQAGAVIYRGVEILL